MKTFQDLGLEENILSAIKDLNFETPMPVQIEVIPHLLEKKGKDILALAQTGTGKTAAFGLPVIQKTDTELKQIQFLILSPTRELCLQISDDLASFSKYKPGIRIAAVFGGANIERQIEKIQKGVQIVSATPGRLLDLINRDIVDLSKINTVVLDEADEMLNMGFREDLEEILRTTPKKKNTLLFSATMPKEIVSIANSYMNDPVEITIGKRNSGSENVEHICYLVQARERYLALKRIVDFNPEIYGIVFCRTRAETQEVADKLIKDGYNADALHGDLSQNQRDAVMKKFRIRHLQLLVATDVAARGLDVDDLTHIINYNLPEENEIYTHRSGRTGRAGRKGISIAIANLKEKNKLHDIEKKINKQFSFAEIPTGKEICEKQLFFLIDRMEKVEVDYTQINPLLPDIFSKLEWLDREELIKKFVSVEFNRFLDYYKNTPDLSSPNSSGGRGKERNRNSRFTRFFINLGFRDKLRPNNIMNMINDYTSTSDIEIGKIEILKNFSFFEVDAEYADTVLSSFKGMEFQGREINLEISGSQPEEKRGRRDGAGRDRKFKEKYSDDRSRGRKGKRDEEFGDRSERRRKRDEDDSGERSERRGRRDEGRFGERSGGRGRRDEGRFEERSAKRGKREEGRFDDRTDRRDRRKGKEEDNKGRYGDKAAGKKTEIKETKKKEWEKFAVEWNRKNSGDKDRKDDKKKEKRKGKEGPWVNMGNKRNR